MQPTNIVRAFLAAAALSAACIGAAPAAVAEDPDVRFLDFVSQYNVPYVRSANVIETGHMVCQMMSNNPHTRTVLDIQEMLATSTGITLRQAAAITTGALGSYCHQYFYLLPGQSPDMPPP